MNCYRVKMKREPLHGRTKDEHNYPVHHVIAVDPAQAQLIVEHEERRQEEQHKEWSRRNIGYARGRGYGYTIMNIHLLAEGCLMPNEETTR